MRAYNSTIRLKQKICIRCGKPCVWFSKKRCKDCARIEDTLARMEDETNEEIEKEGLAELIKVADEIFSKWLRLSSADKNGLVRCYTCDAELRWQDAQCGHYVKRGNLFLRHDPRNCRVQDKSCNEYEDGNMAEYTKRLEVEHPGITDILWEEAALVYKPHRHEIQAVITEYTNKFKALNR